jgi:hypothetical protein
MVKSKYTAGSKIHQALTKLEMLGMDAFALRKAINFKDSTKLFFIRIIEPLVVDNMIKPVDKIYFLTPEGQSRLQAMGRYVVHVPRVMREKYKFEPYKPVKTPSVRPNADDNFNFPSRRGNYLFYRDGKVEAV